MAEGPLDGALPVVGELRGEGGVEAVALGDLLDPDGVRGPVPTAGDEVGRVAGEDEEQEEEEGAREEDRRDDVEETTDDVARHCGRSVGSGPVAGRVRAAETAAAGPRPGYADLCQHISGSLS